MTSPDAPTDSEEDRVVSRRVENPTTASETDERAYDAADPLPDAQPEPSGVEDDGGGSTAERAEADLDADGGGAPTRSE